jgi:hypothetical protein
MDIGSTAGAVKLLLSLVGVPGHILRVLARPSAAPTVAADPALFTGFLALCVSVSVWLAVVFDSTMPAVVSTGSYSAVLVPTLAEWTAARAPTGATIAVTVLVLFVLMVFMSALTALLCSARVNDFDDRCRSWLPFWATAIAITLAVEVLLMPWLAASPLRDGAYVSAACLLIVTKAGYIHIAWPVMAVRRIGMTGWFRAVGVALVVQVTAIALVRVFPSVRLFFNADSDALAQANDLARLIGEHKEEEATRYFAAVGRAGSVRADIAVVRAMRTSLGAAVAAYSDWRPGAQVDGDIPLLKTAVYRFDRLVAALESLEGVYASVPGMKLFIADVYVSVGRCKEPSVLFASVLDTRSGAVLFERVEAALKLRALRHSADAADLIARHNVFDEIGFGRVIAASPALLGKLVAAAFAADLRGHSVERTTEDSVLRAVIDAKFRAWTDPLLDDLGEEYQCKESDWVAPARAKIASSGK